MFLLNSTLLIYANGILCVVASLVGFYYDHCGTWPICSMLQEEQIIHNGFSTISPKAYLLISAILFFFGYRLYLIAVNAAQDFGLFYRAGFDLYRVDLLKQLNHELPKNLSDERNAWIAISEFLIAGERLDWASKKEENYPPYYYHKLEKQKKESNNEI